MLKLQKIKYYLPIIPSLPGLYLESKNIRKIVLNQSREQGCSFEITRILSDRLPFRRNRVLAVVPDVVVKDAKVSAFRDLELSLERWALLRESESSAEQESECQRRNRDDPYNSVHYSNVF